MPTAEQQRGAHTGPPPIPNGPVQEGARWRHHRPSSEAVAAWFNTVPLDEGMEHERYVGGVVLIPQSEKVKHSTEKGTVERYEQVFTPYVQIGTRVAYARRLAESRGLIYAPGPVEVPRSLNPQSPYFNGNMGAGLWWHVVQGDHGLSRFLCATWAIRFYEPRSYAARWHGEAPVPVLEAQGTKQVGGGPDPNGIMKAETGALGRALGVAGVLVVGTGIATAEDMQEFVAQPQAAPQLPQTEIAPGEPPEPARDPAERLAQLRSQALAVQTKMQEEERGWQDFAVWWKERAGAEGWGRLEDVPVEALEGIVQRMEALYAQAEANEPTEVLT